MLNDFYVAFDFNEITLVRQILRNDWPSIQHAILDLCEASAEIQELQWISLLGLLRYEGLSKEDLIELSIELYLVGPQLVYLQLDAVLNLFQSLL